MRDNAVIAHTPAGPVAHVTTASGFAYHLRTAEDVADFLSRPRSPAFAGLLEAYLQAEVDAGRRSRPTGAACTVAEALDMTRAVNTGRTA